MDNSADTYTSPRNAAAAAGGDTARSAEQRAAERAAASPPELADGAPEEAEEDDEDEGYGVDHLSAVIRPVALTMILARCAAAAARGARGLAAANRLSWHSGDIPCSRLSPPAAAWRWARSASRSKTRPSARG